MQHSMPQHSIKMAPGLKNRALFAFLPCSKTVQVQKNQLKGQHL
tara:strand:+ start:1527 stop:1658 length:132 start_codon:yes stop_codon:yes gene_type:complete